LSLGNDDTASHQAHSFQLSVGTTLGSSSADIQNSASYSAESSQVTVGTSAGSSGAGFGNDSGSAASTTQAGISGIAGNTAARTGDAETGINKIFNQQAVAENVNAQVQITQAAGQQVPKATATAMDKQANELLTQAGKEPDSTKRKALLDEAAKYQEGGSYRIAAHTLFGALSGGVGGAAAAGTVAANAQNLNDLQDQLAKSLTNAGVEEKTAKAIANVSFNAGALAAGNAVGGGAGATAALNVDANNRQLHQTEFDLAKKYRKQAATWLSKQEGRTVTPEEAEARIVRQMERGVDYATAKTDGFRTDQAIVSFMGSELPKKDQYYYDTSYNSQYIAPNASAYNAALAQSNEGLTPQQITDRNNKAGAPVAKAAAIALGGYVLAPAVAALGTEVIAFSKNPVVYCSLNPSACIAAVDTAATVTAGVPISGVTLPTGPASTAAAEVKTLVTTEGKIANAELNVAANGGTATVGASSGRGLSVTYTDHATGVATINPTTSVSGSQISRLSTGSNAAPHEVQVAAQLENATGSTIKMVDRPPANPDGSFPKSPDFVFASGPNAGKTGDFMFTAESNKVPSMNTYFDKNWPKTEASLNAHLTKADVVVLDFTNLTPVNQLKVNDWINTLTPTQRGQILIRR
jgi:hypothetical protein